MARPAGQFAHFFRQLRIRVRLTQRQIGRELGVSTRTVVRWENQQRVPSAPEAALIVRFATPLDPDMAARLAECLGVRAEPPPKPPAPPAKPPPPKPDNGALRQAILEAADRADVTAGTLRAALRAIVEILAPADPRLSELRPLLAEPAARARR